MKCELLIYVSGLKLISGMWVVLCVYSCVYNWVEELLFFK